MNDSQSLTGYSQVLRQTEYDADGNIVKETSYVIGHQRISQTVGISGTKTTQFFTFDGHGSTRVLLNATGAVAQLYSFDAYGNALGFNPADALTEFLYNGEQFDAKIGQQYLRARYYDPATGTFNRLDPFFGNLTDPQSLHNYTYVSGDPINMTDPSGLFGVAGIGVSMSIGSAMSGARMGAAMAARTFACGTLSGALVGSIMGSLMEAMKHADMYMNGQSIDRDDMMFSVIIGGLKGAAEGMKTGGFDALKDLTTFKTAGRIDTLSNLNNTYNQMITLYSQGNYFQASFIGLQTLVELGFGSKLNSLFCFVDDTIVMLESGEISEAEAIATIEQQIGTVKQQYGAAVASVLTIVIAGLLVQVQRNRKQNQTETSRKSFGNNNDNHSENSDEFITEKINAARSNDIDAVPPCYSENSHLPQSTWERFRQYLVTSGLLIVFAGLALFLWNSYRTTPTNNTVTHTVLMPVFHSAPSGIKYAKIQDIEVGERAIGKNPEVTDSERITFLSDPEPATWRKLTLEMIKPDGKRLDITLLRPLSWIVESNAKVGNTIFLDLPEMGSQGNANVLAIEPCPPIKSGKGNVITGTFHHEAANTIDIYVDGLDKPIGTTDNHPFWSATKNEFVEAGKLLPGEELQLYNGQPAKVVQILPRPGPERVHNLEVMNEHVYRVAQKGVLVHNACSVRSEVIPYAGIRPSWRQSESYVKMQVEMQYPNGVKTNQSYLSAKKMSLISTI